MELRRKASLRGEPPHGRLSWTVSISRLAVARRGRRCNPRIQSVSTVSQESSSHRTGWPTATITSVPLGTVRRRGSEISRASLSTGAYGCLPCDNPSPPPRPRDFPADSDSCLQGYTSLEPASDSIRVGMALEEAVHPAPLLAGFPSTSTACWSSLAQRFHESVSKSSRSDLNQVDVVPKPPDTSTGMRTHRYTVLGVSTPLHRSARSPRPDAETSQTIQWLEQ